MIHVRLLAEVRVVSFSLFFFALSLASAIEINVKGKHKARPLKKVCDNKIGSVRV